MFYCSPYAHTGFHFIRIVLKSLILYAPYSYGTIINQGIGSLGPQTINTIYIYTWSNFVESELHFKYNDLKLMKNPVLTGYMTYELINERAKLNFESTKKVILYAPHYGVKIDDSEVYYRSSYSSFLEFYNIIEDLRHELGNKLIFIFKPHPALKMMLYRHPNWRKTKTDNYFNSWKTTFSTLYDNDYITAFNLSDCIIYDSVSFIGEYIYTNKPSLYLNNDINLYQNDAIRSYLMEFHYIGNSKDDIYTFLSDIVIDGNDYKKDIRSKFITSQFKNGLLDFSGNVIRFLNDSLKR